MHTNSGAPYMIERTLSAHGGGYGRGWIVTHRASEVGALQPRLEDAVAWMDSDAAYRRARDARQASEVELTAMRMAIGLDALKRMDGLTDVTGCWWSDIDGGGAWEAHDFDPSSAQCVNCQRSEPFVIHAMKAARA